MRQAISVAGAWNSIHLRENWLYFVVWFRKDLLQDVFHLTNCCREEYLSSSQAVQASVTEVKRDQEYANFINKNRYFVDDINTYTLIKKYAIQWKKVNDTPRLQDRRVFPQNRFIVV